MRSATRAWAFLLLSSACSSGGADGSLPPPGEAPPDLGHQAAPASFLSPSGEGTSLIWPREVVYTLAASLPATIHYTLDGSMPMPGGPSTKSGKGPLVLDRPLGDGTLTWFADYGTPFQKEAVRSLTLKVDPGKPRTDQGSLTERVAFAASGGPIAEADAGTEVKGTLIYQAWSSMPAGACPSCQLQYVIFLEKSGVTPVTCVDLVNRYGAWPGKTQTLDFTFKAPAVSGQYRVRAGLTLQGSCNGVVPVTYSDIGLLFVRAGDGPAV